MKNKKKKYIKSILFLLFAIFLLFFINFLHIHIALACPNITYQGDKTVLKEDVIYLGSIKIRDLRIEKMFFSKERTGYIDRKCENHNSE